MTHAQTAKPELHLTIAEGKKIYFASDFHLGVPDPASSREREQRICRWLDEVSEDAAAIFLVGDLFDFWFEYSTAVPKGFSRFLGKLAELTDRGIPVHLFTGNHDLWMFGYLEQELGVSVHHHPIVLLTGNIKILVGHGDGLGPGDGTYKILKRIFTSRFAQFIFSWLHPDIGIRLAHRWSRNSRIANTRKEEEFKGKDREFLLSWCRDTQATRHHDWYIFGHRHLPLDLEVAPGSRYINLGEWVNFSTYAEFNGTQASLKTFR